MSFILIIGNTRPIQGFGDYQIPNNFTFSQFHTSEKIKKIVAIVIVAIACVAAMVFSVFYPVAIPIPILLSLCLSKLILDLIAIQNQAPPMTHLFDPVKIQTIAPLGLPLKEDKYEAIIPKNSKDSFFWKCKLIEKAQHSIVLSGCYAGGKPFDTVLKLIEARMDEKDSKLKVSIITTHIFHTPENSEKIAQLEKKYPDRFLNIAHPEYIPYSSPENKNFLSTNHTKALVIDGGAYFLIGGSGLVSFFTENSGLKKPKPNKENHYGIFSGLGAMAYRDTDFIFHSPSPQGLGARIHIEMSKLIELYRYRQTHKLSPQQDLPNPSLTRIPEFEAFPSKADHLSLACFCSGPEQTHNQFKAGLLQQIKKAKKSILFAQLYFSPTKDIEQALIEAIHRGVKITILTNKTGPNNPFAHYGHAERSCYSYKQLFERKENPNIQIFEYDVPNVSYHKKITVIDEEIVLTGSSNLGSKSLEQNDYEIDFMIKSKHFAQLTLENLKPDLQEKFKVLNSDAPYLTAKTRIINIGLGLLNFFI